MNDIKNFVVTYGYDHFNQAITWGYTQWQLVDHVAGQHAKETRFFDCVKNRSQQGFTEQANRVTEHLQYLYSRQHYELKTRIGRSMTYTTDSNNQREYGIAAQVITVFQTRDRRELPVFAVLLFHDDLALINGAISEVNGRWQVTFPQRNMRSTEILLEQLSQAEPVGE